MPITHESEMSFASLISGGGSTMKNTVLAAQNGELRGILRPVVVIASTPEAGGITKAQELDIPVAIVERKNYPSSAAFGDAIVDVLDRYGVEVVAQNGWLPFTPDTVTTHPKYAGNIYNQHPGPTDPDHIDERGPVHFGGKGMHGLAVHAAVLIFQDVAQRRFPTEATIHRVVSGVDAGDVLFRQTVEVLSDDFPESLAARVLPIEHEAQVQFFQMLYHGTTVPLHREQPLISDHEVLYLRHAIQAARVLYPNG